MVSGANTETREMFVGNGFFIRGHFVCFKIQIGIKLKCMIKRKNRVSLRISESFYIYFNEEDSSKIFYALKQFPVYNELL